MDDLKAKLAAQEVELQQKNEDADKLIQAGVFFMSDYSSWCSVLHQFLESGQLLQTSFPSFVLVDKLSSNTKVVTEISHLVFKGD